MEYRPVDDVEDSDTDAADMSSSCSFEDAHALHESKVGNMNKQILASIARSDRHRIQCILFM